MSVTEKNIRLRIQATSELPIVNDQLEELLKLQRLIAQQNTDRAGESRTQSEAQIKAISGVTDALQKQRAATTSHKKDVDDVDKAYDALGKQVRNFATLVGAAFTLNEIKNFGMQVIDAKTKIDSLKIALDVMLGSKKQSAELFNEIVALAKKTPFSLDEVAENVVKLKAYNIANKDLIPTVEALGNIAAAVGKDKLPQLTLAYGQVINMGKLMGTETKQFIEAGVPLYDLLADSMKKPKEEVIKMAHAHTIMASDVQKAIMQTSEVGGKYYNMMQLQSKTLGGQVSNLGDAYLIAKVRIGDFFENEIKGGIKTLGNLIEATLGSNAAVQRTVGFFTAAATALATWKLATIAQSVATGAMNIATGASTLITGTYNLAMITATGTTEGFTRAQLASAVAARSSWAVLAANPIGAIVAVLGVAATAFMAFKAANVEVAQAMGESEYQIRNEQAGLNQLAEAALSAKEGTQQRKEAIDALITKYPDYFSGLNSEKTSNSQLKEILDKVNESYRQRATAAKNAYEVEKLNENRRSLWDEETAAIARLTEKMPELKKFGNDASAVLEYLNKNADANFKARNANSLSSWFDSAVNGNPVKTLETVNANLKKVEQDIISHEQRAVSIKKTSQESEVAAVHAHYKVLISQADGNSKAIKALKEKEAVEIAKLNGTYRQAETKAATADDENAKKRVSQTAIEIRDLKAKQGELTLQEKKRLLELEEKLDIENIQKSKQTLAAKNTQIEAVIKEFAPKKAALELEFEAKKNAEILVKEAEVQNKLQVIVAQRLEAEKIFTKLETAKTQEERRAVMAEYGKKITDDVKDQAVEQLKAQRDASREFLDQVRLVNGEKSTEYRKANLQFLADDQQYQAALLTQTKEAATAKSQAIREAEAKIIQLNKETFELNKDRIEKEKALRTDAISSVMQMFGQANPIIAQFGGAILTAFNNIDLLSGKTKAEAESRLSSAKSNLAILKDLYTNSGAEGEAMIAAAENNVSKASLKVAEVGAQSFSAAMAIFGMAAQAAQAIADAYNQSMSEMYQAIADGYQVTRDVMNDLYTTLIDMNREALAIQLEDVKGSYAEREALIREAYAQEMVYAEGHDRIDAELAYQQQIAQIKADAGGNIKKYLAGMEQAFADKARRESEIEVANVERSLELARRLRDEKIKSLQEELEAFKQAKQAETDELNRQLEAQKAATNQFFSDKQLRLQQDDAYRNQLLAAGEAREVAALQAAMQRELARATSAEERTNIVNAFEALIALKHAEYQDAIGNKTKEISLANQEAKAQEAGAIKGLESETATEIQRLKDQVAAKDAEVSAAMKAENRAYSRQVISAEFEIMEIKKQMTIAELRAEQALLRGKRWFMNKNKVDSAINELENAINEINGTGGRNETVHNMETAERIYASINQNRQAIPAAEQAIEQTKGKIAEKRQAIDTAKQSGQDASGLEKELSDLMGQEELYTSALQEIKNAIARMEAELKAMGYFTGTEFVDSEGRFSNGIDTVPARLTRGERVLTVDQNNALGGISNEDLVSRAKFYERFSAQFPQLANGWADISSLQIGLPANIMTGASGGHAIDVSGLRDDLRGVRKAIENQKLLNVSIDRNGWNMYEQGAQSKTTYHQNLLKR